MPKLKLSELHDDKPVRVTVELPAKLHRDLVAYAQVLGEQTGQPAADPTKLIAPMLERFIATDRAFTRARRAAGAAVKSLSITGNFGSDSSSERG